MTDFKNPFDPDNFSLGVGWDGKTVTITSSRFKTDMFTYGDGTPYLDDNGEQGYANVWEIKGISEDSENERTESYSIGKSLIPTSDGDSFEHKAGKPNATFHVKAKAAKFAAALKTSGFDLSKLVDDEGKPSAKGLVGAIFVFKALQPIDPKTNEPAVDKGGYAKIEQYPAKFIGWSKTSPAAQVANDGVQDKAYDVITELLTEAEGNTLTRVQLIQALNKKLAGDDDMNAIVQLAVKEDFNSAAPWKLEGNTISLS